MEDTTMAIYECTTPIRDYWCVMIINAKNCAHTGRLIERYWDAKRDHSFLMDGINITPDDIRHFRKTYWDIKCIAINSMIDYEWIVCKSITPTFTGMPSWRNSPSACRCCCHDSV